MLVIAIPMTLSHMTTPLLGLVDMAVIGRMGDAALLGAVALGGVVFDFLFWSFGALRMGTAGLTAQASGAGDTREIDRALARAIAVAMLVGVTLIALQWPIGELAFLMMGASPEVTAALALYFYIRIWAAPFTLANYAILGSMIGRGRTDLGFALQVGLNLINIALTIVLVVGFNMGVAGAAIGTLAAEAIAAGLGLLVLRRLGSNPLRIPLAEALQPAAMKRMLAVNGDIMLRTMALIVAFASFAAIGARGGDVTLAANSVLYKMFTLGAYFLDGTATAAEAMCGQAYGARNRRAFRRAVVIAVQWSLGLGFVAMALFWLAGPFFIDFITTDAAVRLFARDYLIYAAMAPLIGALAFAFDGIYIGATWTRAMRNLMLIALAAYLGALGLGQILGGIWASNHGLWLAFLIFLGARGLGQALLYPRLESEREWPAMARAA
ncbi:MAG: MATE family efflux transporter [Salinarimonas sp.]|nr:MATE family efflux transporter [Salinarimonas sp.]